MKALILAGGRGKRLDNLSSERNKCMIQVNGRHVIEFSLKNAVCSDIDEIVIVVGYRAEDIINRFGNRYEGKSIKYVIQKEQKGLVHAIECAEGVIEGHDFILMLGDEVMTNPRHRELLEESGKKEAFVIAGILEVENRELIKRTYTLIQDEKRRIYRLIEKPRNPFNNYMGTGVCFFSNSIYNYINFTPIHHERMERELPDLIQCAIDEGNIVKSFFICDKYTNINTTDDIRMAENFLKEGDHE